MKTETHKDWTDAFRESFPEEARPEAGGWEAVAGRMRRAAARRRAALVAAALALPLAGGVFFLTRPGSPSPHPEIAVVEAPAPVPQDSPALVADVPAPVTELPAPAAGSSTPIATVPSQVTAPSVLENASPEHQDAQNDLSVLETAAPEHEVAQNDPPVLENVVPEHRGAPVEAVPLPDLPDAFSEYAGDLVDVVPARRRRLTAGLSAGTTAGGAPVTATMSSLGGGLVTKSSNNFWNNTSGVILQQEYVHDLPLGFGLNVRYGLTDRLSLESGLEYTYLHSRMNDLHTVLHFAGVPLRADYRLFSARNIEGYAGIGGKVEKCLKATFGGMDVKEDQLQWSGSALLGIQTRITRKASLYIQPDLSYYFTKTKLTTYRTENRLGLTVRAGLRFDIR